MPEQRETAVTVATPKRPPPPAQSLAMRVRWPVTAMRWVRASVRWLVARLRLAPASVRSWLCRTNADGRKKAVGGRSCCAEGGDADCADVPRVSTRCRCGWVWRWRGAAGTVVPRSLDEVSRKITDADADHRATNQKSRANPTHTQTVGQQSVVASVQHARVCWHGVPGRQLQLPQCPTVSCSVGPRRQATVSCTAGAAEARARRAGSGWPSQCAEDGGRGSATRRGSHASPSVLQLASLALSSPSRSHARSAHRRALAQNWRRAESEWQCCPC